MNTNLCTKKTLTDLIMTILYTCICVLCGLQMGLVGHLLTEIENFEAEEINYQMGLAEMQDKYDELSTSYTMLQEERLALGENVTMEYAGDFLTTAYCTEKRKHICGEGHGITASGQPIQAGVTVAADPKVFPYGTVLYIEGVGIRIVQDKGPAIKDHHLDVAVDTHKNALAWSGYGNHKVYVVHTNDN